MLETLIILGCLAVTAYKQSTVNVVIRNLDTALEAQRRVM
jgi:hypothetical protein